MDSRIHEPILLYNDGFVVQIVRAAAILLVVKQGRTAPRAIVVQGGGTRRIDGFC